MRRAARWLSIGCVVVAGAAYGKPCGDDVDGRDVPCACGDVVVSDVRLADDPVTTDVCPSDGLVVRARPGARGPLRVDLGGRTLRGSGRGHGLWVIAGGPGGAVIESTGGVAVLQDFGDGVVAIGGDALAAARDLRIERPRHAGVRVQGRGWSLAGVSVTDAGGDGFVLGGADFRLDGTRALRSRGRGYVVAGRHGVLGGAEGVVAEGSGGEGVAIAGHGHRLERCDVAQSGRRDVRVTGRDLTVGECAPAVARRRPRKGRS